MPPPDHGQPDFPTDDELPRTVELLFFACRAFTSDPDRILENLAYGRAHHRAIHFINRQPGTTVNRLPDIPGVTKQSLNRVPRRLIKDRLVENRIGIVDRRERHLCLTAAGRRPEAQLSALQRDRLRKAFRAAGPDALSDFAEARENIMDPDMRTHIKDPGKE
ncbi:MAG: winged helix-turn-helix transcriptional regulator [Rhodobacteraceae bacterium]|nr:winged helix-turn-helix transcriptional regulator [Paracoccaceae bacterium]